MTDTSIEWCHRPGTRAKTWNPTDGCEVCSPGCANCYAMRMAGRFSAPGRPYHGLVTIAKNRRAIWNGEGRFNTGRLALPLSWKSPCTVFVNSMSDLFYDAFTNEEIAAVFGVMAATPQHHYIILTKRGRRLPEWFEWTAATGYDPGHVLSLGLGDIAERDPQADARFSDDEWLVGLTNVVNGVSSWAHYDDGNPIDGSRPRWPLPNVTIGVSVEDRKHGVPRIDELRCVPATVRMLSIEPLLEDLGTLDLEGIGWVVVGCESGPGARRMDPRWVRSIRDQCAAAGVAFFLKQAVAQHGGLMRGDIACLGNAIDAGSGSHRKPGGIIGAPYLDGVQHLAFPKVTP